MKKVRCISPHGGGHNGVRHNGTVVHRLPNGDLPVVKPDELRLPPAERGYVECPAISREPIAVGSVVDAPDSFVADGFNFEDVPQTPAPPQPATPAPVPAPAGEGN